MRLSNWLHWPTFFVVGAILLAVAYYCRSVWHPPERHLEARMPPMGSSVYVCRPQFDGPLEISEVGCQHNLDSMDVLTACYNGYNEPVDVGINVSTHATPNTTYITYRGDTLLCYIFTRPK